MTTVETTETSAHVLSKTATTSTSAGQAPLMASSGELKAKLQRIRRDVTDDQICVLTFDRPDSSANIFDQATLVELHQHLDAIEKDSQIRGLVLTSAKK